MKMRKQIEHTQDRITGVRKYKNKHSKCIISIGANICLSDLEEVDEIRNGLGGKVFVPTLSFLQVQEYNPVFHKYLGFPASRQEIVAPNYRNPDSSLGRYFQGVSIALVPGEVENSGHFSSVYTDFEGFELWNRKRIPGSFVFSQGLPERLFAKEGGRTRISVGETVGIREENPLSVVNSLRSFFRDPQPVWSKRPDEKNVLEGYVRFNPGFAKEGYYFVVQNLIDKFRREIPRNAVGFEFK